VPYIELKKRQKNKKMATVLRKAAKASNDHESSIAANLRKLWDAKLEFQ
jgi:hypothetical protein